MQSSQLEIGAIYCVWKATKSLIDQVAIRDAMCLSNHEPPLQQYHLPSSILFPFLKTQNKLLLISASDTYNINDTAPTTVSISTQHQKLTLNLLMSVKFHIVQVVQSHEFTLIKVHPISSLRLINYVLTYSLSIILFGSFPGFQKCIRASKFFIE